MTLRNAGAGSGFAFAPRGHQCDGRHLPGLQPVAAAQPEPATDDVQPEKLRAVASPESVDGAAAAAAAPRAADAGAAAVAVQEEGVEERLDAARPDAADAVAAAAQRSRAVGAEPAARAAAGAGAAGIESAPPPPPLSIRTARKLLDAMRARGVAAQAETRAPRLGPLDDSWSPPSPPTQPDVVVRAARAVLRERRVAPGVGEWLVRLLLRVEADPQGGLGRQAPAPRRLPAPADPLRRRRCVGAAGVAARRRAPVQRRGRRRARRARPDADAPRPGPLPERDRAADAHGAPAPRLRDDGAGDRVDAVHRADRPTAPTAPTAPPSSARRPAVEPFRRDRNRRAVVAGRRAAAGRGRAPLPDAHRAGARGGVRAPVSVARVRVRGRAAPALPDARGHAGAEVARGVAAGLAADARRDAGLRGHGARGDSRARRLALGRRRRGRRLCLDRRAAAGPEARATQDAEPARRAGGLHAAAAAGHRGQAGADRRRGRLPRAPPPRGLRAAL